MITDLLGAFAFLTVIPVAQEHQPVKPGRIFAYFSLVGLVIGLVLAGIRAVEIHKELSAFLTLLGWIAITGGLHLDGFGDACDGLFATTTPEKRLAIMKDSRAGMWGVVGLVILLLGKWITIGMVEPLLLVLPPVTGRLAMVLAARFFRPARASGIGSYFRNGLEPPQVTAAIFSGVFIAVLSGWPAALTILAAPLTAALAGRWAAKRLGGGLTGDVYGWLCELTELICLIFLAVV